MICNLDSSIDGAKYYKVPPTGRKAGKWKMRTLADTDFGPADSKTPRYCDTEMVVTMAAPRGAWKLHHGNFLRCPGS